MGLLEQQVRMSQGKLKTGGKAMMKMKKTPIALPVKTRPKGGRKFDVGN